MSLEMMKRRIDEIWEDYALAEGETKVVITMHFERGSESQDKQLTWTAEAPRFSFDASDGMPF